MLKRIIARLLIITQIYSNLFQGIVHAATLVEEVHHHRPIFERPDDLGVDAPVKPTAPPRDDGHISSFTHLYSEVNELGELKFALGDGLGASRVFTIPTLESPDDILEYGGVTVNAQGPSFRFQGLRISVNRSGVMIVEGCQTRHRSCPVFLASNRPIILNSIEASGLSIAAPRIVHSGTSTIAQLKFEGLGLGGTVGGDGDEGNATFINAGQLTAKELFLNNLNSVNGGSIHATRFALDGRLASTGLIASDELVLEESAFLKLTEAGRADIKTLFLSKASHLENFTTVKTVSLGVLDGLGGSLTNYGTLAVGEIAADSCFQAITNRHFLDIALGTIQTQQFENHGTFIAAESCLQVTSGQNLGAFKTKALEVKTEFSNAAAGMMDISVVSGLGHLRNLGKIETEATFGVVIKRFSNSGLVKAQSVIGWIPNVFSSVSLLGLEQLDNTEDGVIEASAGISFTAATQVNNFGKLQTEDMALYSDKTLQKGDLIARTLNLIGQAFLNQGEITVEHLTAENGLINQASLITSASTDFGAGGLANAVKAKARLKSLGLSCDTRVINHGNLEIEGVDTALGTLQITNTGIVTIDAGHRLPSSSAVAFSSAMAMDPARLIYDAIGVLPLEISTIQNIETLNDSVYGLFPRIMDIASGDRGVLFDALDARVGLITIKPVGSIFAKSTVSNAFATWREQLFRPDLTQYREDTVITTPRSVLDVPSAETAYITDTEFAGKTAHQLKEIAVRYKQDLGFDDAAITDAEFLGKSQYQLKEIAVKYKNLVHENQAKIDPEFCTFSRAVTNGAKYKSEVLGQDPIQGDPEFSTFSKAMEAGIRYKAQAKLALETKLAQLQQERSVFITTRSILAKDPEIKDRIHAGSIKALILKYGKQAGIPEHIIVDELRGREHAPSLKVIAAKYKLYQENPQSYVVEQAIQKVQKELADPRWNFGLTLQERQLREAQLEADRERLAAEIFKVRLSVTNQTTGQLTLRSGHFDLRGDQALVNDGMLTQEAAQLEWMDPATWSQPRSFNAGTWQVKGDLTLMGNADRDVGKLLVEDSLHVDVPTTGSIVLSGQIEVPSFSASGGIELFGTLTTHKSTHLPQGLTITKDAVAELKGLRVGMGVETPADSPFTQRLAKMSHLPGEIEAQQKRIAEVEALYPTLTQQQYETEYFKRDVLPKLYARLNEDCYESYEKFVQSFKRGYPIDISVRDAIKQAGYTVLEGWIAGFVPKGNQFIPEGMQFAKLYGEAERGSLITELRERQSKLEELQRQQAELFPDLRVGYEIINHGTLRVIGVDPTSGGVIQLTNTGSAVIDAQQVLPRLDERSPENLARVATRNGPVTWNSELYDHQFSSYIPSTWKSRGSEYLRLFKALSTKQPYVREYKTEPEFDGYSPVAHKTKATRYKRDFIKLYESLVVKSQTEGSPAEQLELQQYLKQFEPHYQQILTSRIAYAKSSHPAMGTALVVESAQIPAVKLQLLNQTPGQLTLKSGKFEFVGDAALVNDGSLTQHSAYTLWLTSNPGAFSRGGWKSVGSLGLLGYFDARFAELQVGGTLYVDSTNDAFKVLEGLANAQASRVSIKAGVARGMTPELAELYPMLSQKAYETQHFKRDVLPKYYAKFGYPYYESYEKYVQSFNRGYPLDIAIRDACVQAGHVFETFMQQCQVQQGILFTMYSEAERRARLTELAEKHKITCPWPLEILISGNDFTNGFNLYAPSLKISSRIFKTSGHIYAHGGSLDLVSEYGIDVNHAFLGGRDGITVRSKTLSLLANKVATGAGAPNILYKRPELGLYSEAGPVVINVAELITCHYGDIKGTFFTITAPQLINTAGLICAAEPGLKSVLNVPSIKHVRDEQASYRVWRGCRGFSAGCGRTTATGGGRSDPGNWLSTPGCNCAGYNAFYETSNEAILFAQGDLDITYETLEMLASSITSGGKLILASKGVSLDFQTPATGAELPALPGTTTMTKRNGHVNRIVAKYGLVADVGSADMAADMRGENIHIKAALLTLRSLGIAPQQQAQLIDLFTQGSGSSALQLIGDGQHRSRHLDTRLPLTDKTLPDALVVLGPDATRQMSSGAILDVQMSVRAMEEIMGNQIYTLIRGVSGLGLSVLDFFKATSSFVRSHKDTVSQRRLIKAGDMEEEAEILSNPTLTPKDLMASGLPAVFMQFSETIHTLEAERQALTAVASKPRVMLGIPAADARRGIIADKTAVLESVTDLTLATSVRAKDQVAIIAAKTLTVASDVMHHQTTWENYHQTLDRTQIESDRILLQGHDVHLQSINTQSTQRTDIVATGGSVIDESVALTSHRIDRHYSSDESTIVRTTHVHQTVSEHASQGVVNVTAAIGILQQGTHLANATLEAPVVIQDAVHDQHIVDVETIRHKKAGGIFGQWFGITERKTTHSSSAASIARGAINAGREFIATATERFRAVAPSFTAERSDITAPQVEITTGVSQQQSFTQSTYQGLVWNKSSITTERHVTHLNPTFAHNVYLHSPSVILQRVRGSTGTFDKIISDTPVQFRDVDDQHHSTHQSQKSLSAGATLILSLAVTLATANPAAAASIEGAMLSAAYGTLCSQTAVCLVEKDGNLGKAMDELGRRDIGKSMLISAASAGLTKGIGDKLGITGSTAFDNLAKKHLLQSAINTTLSVAIDGQKPEDAIKQGMTSAAINTLAAYAAGKIGDVRDESRGEARIDAGTHKLLHGILGAGSGALAGAITQQDIGRSALSGSVGAILGETFAELTQSKQLGDLLATSLAFGTGLDSIISYQTSHNATEHNFSGVHDFVEAHQANLVWDEEDVADGAEVIARRANEALDGVTDVTDRAWDYLAMLEQRHGLVTYSGYDMDGMEYTPGSTTFRSGTRILVDFLKVPETPNLAALHLMTVIPGAGKVIGAGVQGAFTMGERAARWVTPRASATLKPLLERTGQLSERVRTGAPKVMEHVKAHVREQLEYFPRSAALRHELRAQGYSDRAINKMLAKGTLPESRVANASVKAFEAEDALTLQRLSKEQPWFVRPGQEWKAQVFGRAQVTGGSDVVAGKAHAFRAYREAIPRAKQDSEAAIFLNQGVRKATGHPIAAPNTRPDVTIRRADGVIDQIEVKSRTDKPRVLLERMQATQSRLLESMQGGTTRVVEFTKEIP